MTATPTSRRTQTAATDAGRVFAELHRLLDLLPDLEVIGYTRQYQAAEQVHVHSHPGPAYLDAQGTPKVREAIREIITVIKHASVELQRARVTAEGFLNAPGADTSISCEPLRVGELDELRKARDRRVANEGDPRSGEWEATAMAEGRRPKGA